LPQWSTHDDLSRAHKTPMKNNHGRFKKSIALCWRKMIGHFVRIYYSADLWVVSTG
jgi:hypothetical protein